MGGYAIFTNLGRTTLDASIELSCLEAAKRLLSLEVRREEFTSDRRNLKWRSLLTKRPTNSPFGKRSS